MIYSAPPTLVSIFIFTLGTIFGSFYNVCVFRNIEKKNLTGRSHCPKCQTLIPWYLNLPLISFLILKGKCKFCNVSISVQYPLVEAFSGLLFLGLYLKFGLTYETLSFVIFSSILLIVSVIDLHIRIIPDEYSLTGLILGLLNSFFSSHMNWVDSVSGLIIGGGLFLAIAYLYEKFAKQEGLGGGDVKLLAMIGAWLGVKSVLLVIIISSALGSVLGIFLVLLKKGGLKTAIPFGPFLSLAALVELFFKDWLHPMFFIEF